jgi:uncharacterized protein YbjT (DUF2867 family)
MSHDRVVLVTGATGRQGGAVARHLLAAGFPVRALTRNPDGAAARALAEKGATLVKGDLDDPGSLARAVEGAYGVFSVQNYWEKGVGFDGEVRQGRSLADAAKAAGVKHFVQSSIADAENVPQVKHFDSKARIERYIDEIGLPRTFVRTVFYMDNFLDPKGGSLLLPLLSGILGADAPLHMIAVDDIGAVTAAVFREPERFLGRSVDVAGDRLTVAEMRETYARVTGRRAKGWSIPAFVSRFFNAEFVTQLQWNRTNGWQFPLDETRRIAPQAARFEDFLRSSGSPSL